MGNTSAQDISFRSDGTLFAYFSGSIYTINTTTGARTLVGNGGQGFLDGNGLAFSANDTLFTANQTYVGTVNTTTGHITPVATLTYPQPPLLSSFNRANGMDFDTSTGILWASVASGSNNLSNFLTQIDTTTGNVTVIGQTVTGLDALAVRVRAVPEPSSLVLTALGVIGLVGYRRRRRSR